MPAVCSNGVEFDDRRAANVHTAVACAAGPRTSTVR